MGGLGALKRTMGFTIILVFAIFLGLLTIVSVFFLDPTTALVLGLVGAFFIILLQYLVGPVIVKATSFFFSSRRRHTRSLCDWSSDVCSSDLAGARPEAPSCSPTSS